MFDNQFRDDPLPVFGCWRYQRLPDGGLVQSAPERCPRGHELGPWRATLHWNPSLRTTTVCCTACYAAEPATAMFRPAEPDWMQEFHALIDARDRRGAMAVINRALPPPAGGTVRSPAAGTGRRSTPRPGRA